MSINQLGKAAHIRVAKALKQVHWDATIADDATVQTVAATVRAARAELYAAELGAARRALLSGQPERLA